MNKAAIAFVAIMALPSSAAFAQTPDDMRREIEAEYRQLKAASAAQKEADAAAAAEAALFEQAREAARIERSRVDMTPCGTAGMAYVMSQAAVKMLLRAPATAQFPASPSVAHFQGNCTWYIMGELDSQNGFGALLRSNYVATMIYRPSSDTWGATEVNILPNY